MRSGKGVLLMTGLVVLAGCSSLNHSDGYIKQPTVCVDKKWYGYHQGTGCPSIAIAAAATPAASDELDVARREIGVLQKRIASLDGQLAAANQRVADLDGRRGPTDEDLSNLQKRVVYLQNQLDESEARLAATRRQPADSSLAKAEKDLLKALQPEISKGAVSVHQTGHALTINLASGLLFESGQDQLKAGGADALNRVGGVLKDFPEKQVHVAGYADNVPIKGALQKKYPSNKELSDARANSAAQALRDGGVASLTAAGHGESDPIASNNTATGRAKNRRVEVVVK
ncbi:MAG: OmpA family protein [Nitrospira sp.]|nr:OmpA family protein [Nitrospira sp.]